MDDLTSKIELIRDLEKECDSIIITPFTESYELRALKAALRMTIKRIEKASAVDAVEVVRCKDCIGKSTWYNDAEYGFFICGMSGMYPRGENDYCSYGERKTE